MISTYSALCIEYTVRLLLGGTLEADYIREDTVYDNYYYIKDRLTAGRVEVCIEGNYTAICMDTWSHLGASVICNQLGFSPNGRLSKGKHDKGLDNYPQYGIGLWLPTCTL